MLGRMVFLVIEVFVLLVFGWLVFDVVVRGSLLAVLAIAMVGAAAFNGLGLLVASRPQTIEGLSGLQNLVMVPMWILSGVFFASSNFPERAQPFDSCAAADGAERCTARRHDGGSLTWLVWHLELAILLAWTIVGFALALIWFRWH